MIKISSIRGMHDLVGQELSHHHDIINQFISVAHNFNFKPISTPIMEFSEVFKRTLGDSSDVVMKEMYSFIDKSEESLTLRPEGTAGIARAIISKGLTQDIPLKLYYFGPMFRYERPQKGRLRQFTQLGIEMFSNVSHYREFEVISLADKLLKKLCINNNLTLHINNLGDIASRSTYVEILKKYYIQKKNSLSEDSLKRLKKNPLRILDSKSAPDIEINKNAPLIKDYLSKESNEYFNKFKILLIESKIKFYENPFLVRGLDYYNNSIFEYTLKDNDKYAVLAGGSYDNLVKDLGGPTLAGIGWAAGVERLIDLIEFRKKIIENILILPMDEELIGYAYKAREVLFNKKIKSEVYFVNNLKKAFKYANKIQASYAIIIGKDEIKKSLYSIKNLVTGKQELIDQNKLLEYLENA
ncbi:histidine--tRNA ligase [Alphaproteobacteria bacterium]|nr:histidine--tRNA ligase [Alphaproteobacteria bacterium]